MSTPLYRLARQDYVFVGLQGFLFLAYFIVPKYLAFTSPTWLRWLGWVAMVAGAALIVVAILQLNTSLSPFPRPVPGGRLVTGGAFAVARHPIYAGLLWAAVGNALRAGSGSQVLITLLLGVLFYFKSAYEERLLTERFPEYAAYRGRVGRFGGR